MFDIGGWEFLLIIMLALLIIGPKDLPLAVRTITQWIRKARSLAQDFQYNLDDIVTQAELDKVKSDLIPDSGFSDMKNDIKESLEFDIGPHREPDGSKGPFKNPADNPATLGDQSSEDHPSPEENSLDDAERKGAGSHRTGKTSV